MKNYLVLVILLFPILFFSCRKRGCIDNNALNDDVTARKDNGTCKYSQITFYSLYDKYGSKNAPVASVDMTVNNAYIGTVTGNYPAGPTSCNDPGNVFYQIVNMSAVSWTATIHYTGGLAADTVVTGDSGPNHFTQCIKINVTPK
jgi:hypothetical protein